MGDWWKCPNGTCEHGGIFHDAYDLDDPSPTCCWEGCQCGHNHPSVIARRNAEVKR